LIAFSCPPFADLLRGRLEKCYISGHAPNKAVCITCAACYLCLFGITSGLKVSNNVYLTFSFLYHCNFHPSSTYSPQLRVCQPLFDNKSTTLADMPVNSLFSRGYGSQDTGRQDFFVLFLISLGTK
jgi:hypothetical protein